MQKNWYWDRYWCKICTEILWSYLNQPNHWYSFRRTQSVSHSNASMPNRLDTLCWCSCVCCLSNSGDVQGTSRHLESKCKWSIKESQLKLEHSRERNPSFLNASISKSDVAISSMIPRQNPNLTHCMPRKLGFDKIYQTSKFPQLQDYDL